MKTPILLLLSSLTLFLASQTAQAAPPALGGPTPVSVVPPQTMPPRILTGLAVPTAGATPQARALDFIAHHGALLGGVTLQDVRVRKITRLHTKVIVALQQVLEGLDVERRTIAIVMNPAGVVDRVQSDWIPAVLAPAQSDIGADEAAAIASRAYGGAVTGHVVEVVLAPAARTTARAWRVPVAPIPGIEHWIVWVSAADGRILQVLPGMSDMRSVGGLR